jgi:hypothetical protein
MKSALYSITLIRMHERASSCTPLPHAPCLFHAIPPTFIPSMQESSERLVSSSAWLHLRAALLPEG